MLQDNFLPDYDYNEIHSIEVMANASLIFPVVITFDFSNSWLINFLFKLRGMTSKMTTKEGLLRENFIELSYRENDELVLGLIGQFWTSSGNLKKVSPADFPSFHRDNFLKATWNFKLIPKSERLTVLQTETRVKCLGNAARRKFSFYWFFIRPFSGLIRKEMLRSIKKKVEMQA